MLYNWRNDVYDVTDNDDTKTLNWDSEAVDSAFYAAGETIAAQDGSDPLDEASSIIGLWYIADRSKLAQCLDLWFELHDDTREGKVRDYTPYAGGFLFVTGAN